jgi:hypothetical protein
MMNRITVRVLCRAWLILALGVATNCRILGQQPVSKSQNKTSDDGTVYYLDSKRPSVTQPIDSTTKDVQTAKFVQVEITSVQNPRKSALSFEVHYEPSAGQNIYLGTFSLYPADNPGTFIVPTQGKLKNQGALILSMTISDKDNNGDIKVGVKKLQLRQK